ncbi:MAG: DUF4625 domain-containing protein [Flavobacteriales bacterium]
MKKLHYIHTLYIFIVLLSTYSCSSSDNKVDTTKPVIELTAVNAFPTNCDTIYFDETFTLKALLTDNIELGSFNIDVHNNFDHHTHSTEFESCVENPIKTPVNPYIFIQDYSIPPNLTTYNIDMPLLFPSKTGSLEHDEGDYHFQITAIDKEGWSILKGLNVKILNR